MKAITRLVLLGAAVLGLQLGIQAQVFPISAQLTLQQQDNSTFKDGIYVDKVRTFRLSSNYILNLLQPFYAGQHPNGFPYGSRLMLVNFKHFQVQSATGAILVTNTEPYLTYSDTFSQTNFLFQGKENVNSGALNHFYFYHSTIQFQDPSPQGTSFSFTGNAVEKYMRSAEDVYGDYLSQGSLMITGFGSGKIDGSFFLLSGKFSTPTIRWIE